MVCMHWSGLGRVAMQESAGHQAARPSPQVCTHGRRGGGLTPLQRARPCVRAGHHQLHRSPFSSVPISPL